MKKERKCILQPLMGRNSSKTIAGSRALSHFSITADACMSSAVSRVESPLQTPARIHLFTFIGVDDADR